LSESFLHGMPSLQAIREEIRKFLDENNSIRTNDLNRIKFAHEYNTPISKTHEEKLQSNIDVAKTLNDYIRRAEIILATIAIYMDTTMDLDMDFFKGNAKKIAKGVSMVAAGTLLGIVACPLAMIVSPLLFNYLFNRDTEKFSRNMCFASGKH
jgi:hypothetical protein